MLGPEDSRCQRWVRYSERQDRKMEWEGFIGAAEYEGDLAPYWPYLVFGQYVQVGKGASFGLGTYEIAAGGVESE